MPDARLPLPDEVADIFAADAPAALARDIVPDDDETDVAIDSTIVLTFNNKIDSETITVASEGGDLVAGSKSWNATGKILTFTPTASLTNATMYIVTIAGVADIYGQSMATVVKNFMTVNAK